MDTKEPNVLINNQLESSSNPSNADGILKENKKERLCRLCAKTTGKMVYIFSDDGSQQDLAYKINSCLPITVKVTDPLPKQLCSSCIEKLNIAYEFSKNCVAAEDKLNACMEAKIFRSRSIPNMKEGSLETNQLLPEAECSSTCNQDINWSMQNSRTNNKIISSDLDLNSITGSTTNIDYADNLYTISGAASNILVTTSNSNNNNNNNTYITLQNVCTSLEENSNNDSCDKMFMLDNACSNLKALSITQDCEVTHTLQSAYVNMEDKSKIKIVTENKLSCINSNCFSCPLCCLGKMKNIVKSTDNEVVEVSDHKEMPCPNDVNKTSKVENLSLPTNCLTQTEVNVWNSDNGSNNSGVQNNVKQELNNNEENVSMLGQVVAVQNNFTSGRSTECQICGDLFLNLKQCLEHSQFHINVDSYPCTLCDMCFTTESEWRSHSKGHLTEVLEHENSKHIHCNDCNQMYSSEEVFSKHVCLAREPNKDEKCNKLFTSELTFLHCSNNFHLEIPICCKLCNNNYDNPANYCLHMKNTHSANQSLFFRDYKANFETKSNYMVHVHTVPDNMHPYKCKHCGKQFQNHQVLQEHYVTHMEAKTFKCNFCGLCLTGKNLLKHHILSCHSNSFPPQSCFQCNICEEVFVKLAQTASHLHTNHNCDDTQSTNNIKEITIPTVYKCEYCEKCYAVQSSLKVHSQEHTENNLYICKFCNATFSTYNRVARHKVIHMKSGSQMFKCTDPEEEFIVPTMFVCFECDKCFPHWTAICHHRRNHHKRNYHCHICNEAFDSPKQLTKHIDNSHILECKTDNDSNLLRCEFCGKTFNHRSTLSLHQNVHAKRKSYTCEICGESFRLKNVYDKHYRKHTGERPFICDICGKTFSQNSGLYTHRRVHTGEKPYACDLCERTFRLKHDRDNHRRCHTGERPYKCQFCTKAFRTSHDHRQHLLIHTGQRPYPCDFCGKGFRRINGLNVHKRIHTGEKPYGCEMCGRHFTQKGDMLKHRKTQHGLV